MIVYPDSGYNSFVSLEDANTYFNDRLNVSQWDDVAKQEPALISAYRSLNELDITIDPTVAVELQAVKDAQCEQALWELAHDSDMIAATSISLAGMVSVKIPPKARHPRTGTPKRL